MAKGKKTGGRQKGTPNKGTAEFKEFFDEKNFSCAEEWFNIYEALRQAPEQLLYMDIRIKVLEKITERLHGKVKEASPVPQVNIDVIELKQVPNDKLIEVLIPDAKVVNQ